MILSRILIVSSNAETTKGNKAGGRISRKHDIDVTVRTYVTSNRGTVILREV